MIAPSPILESSAGVRVCPCWGFLLGRTQDLKGCDYKRDHTVHQEFKCFTGSNSYIPHGDLSERHCYQACFPEEETEAQRAQYSAQGTALKVAGLIPGPTAEF